VTARQPTVRLASAEDVAAAASTLADAFHANSMMIALIPDADRRHAFLPGMFRLVARYSLTYGHLYVADLDGEGVIAAACWLGPERTREHLAGLLRSGIRPGLLRLGIRGLIRLQAFDQVSHLLHRDAVIGPHHYLWSAGVASREQGTGIGAQLLAPALAAADAEHLPCYLETMDPRTIALYSRLGFEIAAQAPVLSADVSVTAMLRPAR